MGFSALEHKIIICVNTHNNDSTYLAIAIRNHSTQTIGEIKTLFVQFVV